MSDDFNSEKYDLVFSGQVVKGVDLAVAKKNIGQLFKLDAKKVEALFSGKKVVLKRGLNMDAAGKYRVAIKKAGALVELVMQQPVAPSRGKAVFGEPPAAGGSPGPGAIPGTGSMGTIPGTGPSSATSAGFGARGAAAADEDGFGLAPPGADLLQPQERKEAPVVEVDTSGLSVRAEGGNLLDDSEYRSTPERELDLSDYDLAEPGADVLKPEERRIQKPVEVDVSGLSAAAPGENLAPPRPAPPPAPDVSGIELVDNT